MGSKKPVKVGYRYLFGIHMGIGKAIDELVAIEVGGKRAWTGSVTSNQRISINAPELFGGDDGEGGISGSLDVMMGAPDQPVNASLAAMLGGLVPAFRGVCTLFYDGLVTSMNPYPKAWKMRVRRGLTGWDGAVWYPERCVMNMAGGTIKAMNPAHIIYECLTNRDWGGAMDRSRLNDASFRAAADVLHAEGFGLCLRWVRQDSLSTFVSHVLDHIGGNLFVSRQTGEFELTLVRDDYDPESLHLFDEDSGLLSITEDDNSATAGAANEVIIKWRNPIDNSNRQKRERSLAAIQSAGQQLSVTIEYPGIPTDELAGRVAVRDLRARSIGLKRFKVQLDRRGRNIKPGAPFRIRSLSRGIELMVVRAGRFEDGTLADGKITITAVQDVFGLPATSMTPPQPGGWVPPDTAPAPVAIRRLTEVTWRDLVQTIDAANLNLVDQTTAFIAALAIKPTSLSLGFAVESRVGSAAYVRVGPGDFCPTGLLVAGISSGAGPSIIQLSAPDNLDLVEVGSAALIDNEVVRVDAINLETLSVTIARGCVDTVPAAHSAGARVWFFEDYVGEDPTEYSSGVSVQVRLRTVTSSGTLAPELAGTDTLALVGRQALPYPPGNLRLNGASYPTEVTGEVTVSVSHRDRLLQADQLIDTLQGDIGPEAGTEYRFRFYSGTTLRRTVQQAGTSYTYLLGTEISDGGPFNPLRVVVDSVRGGVYSLQAHDITVARLGLVTAPPIRLSVTPTAFGADTTAHLVAMPAVVEPGDLLLMHFVNDGNATVATPAGWTLLNTTLSGTQVRSSWYWKLAAGTEDGTTVDLVTSAAEHAAAQVHRFQAGTFDAAVAPAIAVATGTSVSPNPPNLAPSWGEADTYWIAAYGADDDDATTGWPWTEGQTYTPSGTGTTTCSAASCVLALRVASIDPATFTMAASEEWVAATIAIKPA